MTREEYKKEIFGEPSSSKVYKSAKKYIASIEAQLKAKDKEIERLKGFEKIIDMQNEATSCDECKYNIDESWCKYDEHCIRAWRKDYYTKDSK